MAQSLVCRDCNTLLRSVKEAQDHADATGHANFEESTEAVLKLECKECGKVARNETEKDLHTKRTGHTEFLDKTGQEATPMDTEAQMKESRAELGDDKPSSTAAAAPEELVPAEVDETVVDQMLQMGFERNRSVRAIYSSGGSSVDAAVTWLADHEADADLDEALMVPKATAKKKLTPEEAKAQAAELVRQVREKREAEDKEREKLRERERVRMGKEIAAIARAEEDNRLRLIAEERAREKAEEERARQKIKRKLEEDRRERRRRMGLPEELTEEEKEEERRREQEKAEEEAKRRLPVKPVVKTEKMRKLLVDMKKAHPDQDEGVRTAFQTLLKFITNVGMNPSEEKYRRIRLTNPAVQQRVVAFEGGVQFLEQCGFQKDASGENMEMPGDKVDVPVLEAAAETLTSALNNPFFGVL